METRCYGFKKISVLRYKATWIGGSSKVLRQFWVSIKSHFVYPFVKKDVEATRNFFENIYSDKKVDDLIFDGNDHEYLEKAREIIEKTKQFDYVYDCGCGNGSFYEFLLKEHVKFNQYIGIDFAIQDDTAEKKDIKFVKADVENFEFNDQASDRLIVLCNVSCYLSDEKLTSIFKKVAKGRTAVLIIDPVPGLFWDATFDHVKLFYRSPNKMKKLLLRNGFSLKALSQDYLLKLASLYFFPLSYAAVFTFTD